MYVWRLCIYVYIIFLLFSITCVFREFSMLIEGHLVEWLILAKCVTLLKYCVNKKNKKKIAREEEDEQQTDQLQPQPQRASRAAVRQFWVRWWLREDRRKLWARELVADRERSCKNLTTRIYSHLLVSSRINSCLIVSLRVRSWAMGPDRA